MNRVSIWWSVFPQPPTFLRWECTNRATWVVVIMHGTLMHMPSACPRGWSLGLQGGMLGIQGDWDLFVAPENQEIVPEPMNWGGGIAATLLDHGRQPRRYHGNIFCWERSDQGTCPIKLPHPCWGNCRLCPLHASYNPPGRPRGQPLGQADDMGKGVKAIIMRLDQDPCSCISVVVTNSVPLIDLHSHREQVLVL